MNKYFYIVFISIVVVILSAGYYAFTISNPIEEKKESTLKTETKAPQDNLKGKKFVWIKSELNLNKEVVTPLIKAKYSISFEEGNKIKIFTDCNNGFGEYEVKDQKITFGNITSTEKYCPESQEGVFYNELISSQSFILDKNGNLNIDFKIGTIFMKEVNSIEQVNGVVSNPLIGKEYRWLRTELKNNKIILPKVQGKFKLSFSEDLKFTVSTDCNTNGGTYTLNENNLVLRDILATRMYCEESQEDAFIKDLQKTSTFEFLPDQTLILNLSNNSGRIYFR